MQACFYLSAVFYFKNEKVLYFIRLWDIIITVSKDLKHDVRRGNMPVIALANQKGGVGKTTLNVNLAGIMSKLGFSTLIIDADPQCNSTSYFLDPNLPEEETLTEIYSSTPEKAVLQKIDRPTRISRLNIVPGGFSLSARVWEIAQDRSAGRRIKLFLDLLLKQRTYDFVFIDCPPDIGVFTMGAFFAADYVIIPIQPEKLAVDGVGLLLEKIHNFWTLRNEDKPQVLGTITTMFHGANKSHKDWAAKIEEMCGDSYLGLIHRSSIVSTACDAGILLQEDKQNSRGRPLQQHLAIAREILSRLEMSAKKV